MKVEANAKEAQGKRLTRKGKYGQVARVVPAYNSVKATTRPGSRALVQEWAEGLEAGEAGLPDLPATRW